MFRSPWEAHRHVSAVVSQFIGRPHGMRPASPARVFMFVCDPGHFGVAACMVERHGDM